MIEIRRVRRGDEERLRDVRLRALADAPDAFGGTLDGDLARPMADWAALAADSDRGDAVAVFAAASEANWVGVAAGRWQDRERGVVLLWGMWVAPEIREARVGARLVAAVEGWAREQGARTLRLCVMEGVPAEGFYARLGFTPTGETEPLARDPALTEVYLSRPI
jgi:GNAT superfamily N-acetyltransferase